MRFYLIITAIVAAAAVTLFAAFGVGWRTWLEVALVVGALLPLVVRHSPKLYLLFSKLRFFVANVPSTWDLSVRFADHQYTGDSESLARNLIVWAGGNSAIIANSGTRTVARLLRRFVLEIATEGGDFPGIPENLSRAAIEITIFPVTVGYRHSKRFLDDELLPMLEEVQRLTKADWVSYALRVDLPERNPFYGLYLNQLNVGAVRKFGIEFAVPTKSKHARVTVAKSGLTVVSDTLDGFRRAASAALAFQIPAN